MGLGAAPWHALAISGCIYTVFLLFTSWDLGWDEQYKMPGCEMAINKDPEHKE
jgi:hypothetical protein